VGRKSHRHVFCTSLPDTASRERERSGLPALRAGQPGCPWRQPLRRTAPARVSAADRLRPVSETPLTTLPSGSGKEQPRELATGFCSAVECSTSARPRFGKDARTEDLDMPTASAGGATRNLTGDTVSRPPGPSGPGERSQGLRTTAGAPTQPSGCQGPAGPMEDRQESPHSCHKEKPLDVALHADPLGTALLREGAQVGSAVFQRFAAGRSREGGWSGRGSCRSSRFADRTGLGPEQGERPPHARMARFGAPRQDASASRRRARATTTTRHEEPSIGQAQGSIGRPAGGNAGRTQRTSQRTKALRSRKPSERRTFPPRSRGRTTRRERRDQRREGRSCGGPVPRVGPSFTRTPCPGLPGKGEQLKLGSKERLTRGSCCGGESSEGCDATGKGHGKPVCFQAPRHRRAGSSESKRRPLRLPAGRQLSRAGSRTRAPEPAQADNGPAEERETDPEAGNLANPMIGFRAQ
jgi:hypothetical protein